MMLLVALVLVAEVAARSSTEKFSLGKVAEAGRHITAKKVSVRFANYPLRRGACDNITVAIH
jgi:hypothetical protein